MDWRQLIIDGIWLVLLLTIFAFFWQALQALREYKRWPSTKGRIITLEWLETNQFVWPQVTYSYHVQDQEFMADGLFPESGQYLLGRRSVQQLSYSIANAYEKKEEITVFYNPDDPRQAVLATTIPRKLLLIVGLLLFFIVLHLSVMISRLV